MNPSNCIRGTSCSLRAMRSRPGQGWGGGFPTAHASLVGREIPRGLLQCTASCRPCWAMDNGPRISGRVGLI